MNSLFLHRNSPQILSGLRLISYILGRQYGFKYILRGSLHALRVHISEHLRFAVNHACHPYKQDNLISEFLLCTDDFLYFRYLYKLGMCRNGKIYHVLQLGIFHIYHNGILLSQLRHCRTDYKPHKNR